MKALKIIGIFFCSITAIAGFTSIIAPTDPETVHDTLILTVICIALDALLIYKLIHPSPKREKPPKPEKKRPEKAQRPETWEERESRRHNVLMDRVNYVMGQTELPVVQNVRGMILKPGEICHYQSDAYVLVIKNEVVGHTAGHRGISVRVAKGVTLHSGGSRGHSIRQDVSYTYPGVFTMTNKRFVMTGEKAFEYSLDKLTYFNDYDGGKGLVMQFGRSSFTVLMNEPYWVPKIIDLLRIQANSQSAQ